MTSYQSQTRIGRFNCVAISILEEPCMHRAASGCRCVEALYDISEVKVALVHWRPEHASYPVDPPPLPLPLRFKIRMDSFFPFPSTISSSKHSLLGLSVHVLSFNCAASSDLSRSMLLWYQGLSPLVVATRLRLGMQLLYCTLFNCN